MHLVIVYAATTIGSIAGGYLSSYLIRKGWPVLKARKTALLTAAICPSQSSGEVCYRYLGCSWNYQYSRCSPSGLELQYLYNCV